jgi:uncharacterized membrane protein YqjE
MAAEVPAHSARPVREQLGAMLASYRAAAGATADLAAAELQLAASTAVLLLALAVAMALFASSAWLLLMLAIAAAIAGAPQWLAGLTIVAIANLAAAGVCWLWMRATTPNLTFRELRSALANRWPRGQAAGAG